MDNDALKSIAFDILNNINNEHSWLNIKLPKLIRIEELDKDNDYFVKPNDCRWWYGDTKEKRYNNLSKKVSRGRRKELQIILEHIHNIRKDFYLFIPKHPVDNYKFEKSASKPGFYELCKNGLVVTKNFVNSDNTEECPICYDIITNKNYYVTDCCGKKFCGSCIFKHYYNKSTINTSCPLCRQKFVNVELESGAMRRNVSDEFISNYERQTTFWDNDATAYISNIEAHVDGLHNDLNNIIDNNLNDILDNTWTTVPSTVEDDTNNIENNQDILFPSTSYYDRIANNPRIISTRNIPRINTPEIHRVISEDMTIPRTNIPLIQQSPIISFGHIYDDSDFGG